MKTFKVFGEPVEILVSGEMTGGLSTTLIQTSPPGGGPPPHSHVNEDETFYVLEGDYELLADGQWIKVAAGECAHALRGSFHTFRNAGTTTGRMLVFVAPGGLDKYLEELSAFRVPDDMAAILALSERYGIAFA
jgi:quercetin dioxygenase-like cupin family protein